MTAILPNATGDTTFIRCTACQTLYIPDESPIFDSKANTMTWAVYWRTPPVRRKPALCKHDQGMEWWNGKDWVDLPTHPRTEERTSPDGPASRPSPSD